MPLSGRDRFKPSWPLGPPSTYAGASCLFLFREAGGATIYDATLHGLAATFSGNPTWVVDTHGAALLTASQAASVPISNFSTSDFTWAIRFKPNALGSYHGLICRGSSGQTGKFYFTSGNEVALFVAGTQYGGNAVLSMGVWYTALVTMRGTSIAIYLRQDGHPAVLDSSARSSTGTVSAVDTPLWLLRDSGSVGQFFDGKTDLIGLWPYAMPAAQALAFCNGLAAPIKAARRWLYAAPSVPAAFFPSPVTTRYVYEDEGGLLQDATSLQGNI